MTYKHKEQIGDATLYLGDCLEVIPTLGKVDAVVTDPPYGIGFKYNTHSDKEKEYKDFMCKVVPACSEITVEGGALFFWQGMKHIDKYHLWFPPGYRAFAAIRNFTQHLPTFLQYSWDPVIWWVNGKSERRAIAGERDFHIGNTAKWVAQTSNGHPCPRPLDTVEYICGFCGETVLDPFMGSGTTGVACAKLGRKFIGIEIDPDYFDIACKRIEDAYAQPDLFVKAPEPVAEQQSLL